MGSENDLSTAERTATTVTYEDALADVEAKRADFETIKDPTSRALALVLIDAVASFIVVVEDAIEDLEVSDEEATESLIIIEVFEAAALNLYASAEQIVNRRVLAEHARTLSAFIGSFVEAVGVPGTEDGSPE